MVTPWFNGIQETRCDRVAWYCCPTGYSSALVLLLLLVSSNANEFGCAMLHLHRDLRSNWLNVLTCGADD